METLMSLEVGNYRIANWARITAQPVSRWVSRPHCDPGLAFPSGMRTLGWTLKSEGNPGGDQSRVGIYRSLATQH